MGNAAIWWYPDSTRADGGGVRTLQTIDFGEPLGPVRETPDDLRLTTDSLGGLRSVVSQRTRYGIRLVHEYFDDPELARQVASLASHLTRGGVIAVTRDTQKSWAGYCDRQPTRGDTSVRTAGNPWGGLSGGSQVVAEGDEIVLSSFSPEGLRSYHLVAAFDSGAVDRVQLDSDGPVTYSPRLPVFARWRYFWPNMVLDVEQQGGRDILISEDDVHKLWTLDVHLVEHVHALESTRLVPPSGFRPPEAEAGNFVVF